MNKLQNIYQPLLLKAIKIKYWLVAGTAFIFFGTLIIFKNMGGEFIPQLQEGDFAYHCILPQKLTQPEYRNLYASFTDYKSFDEVKMVVGKTGAAEVPTDPMPPEATDMIVVLKPQSEWKTKNLTTN